VHFVKEDFWPLNTTLYVRDFKGNDERFISYFLRSLNFQSFNDKSSVPGLNRNDLHRLEVSAPLPAEQRAVAGVLGALDDKIEQNRRTSVALERLARTMYRAWFVDFEPVKAKAAGATSVPSMPQAVFDALPTTFANSELGPIPEGWTVGKFGDIAIERRETVDPSEIEPSTPYIGLEHMPRRCVMLSEWENAGTVTSGKARFHAGQILFGELRPYFHKVGVAPVDGVCSTDIVVIEPNSEELFGLALAHASSDEFVAHTNACSTGTKMPRTNWRDMARYSIAIPPTSVALACCNLTKPMSDLMVASIFESRHLAALRDYLLPKLLSGAVRVRDAERLAEPLAYASG
jgi:type I restriction enzyme S subunit